jgi:hypothetical protein
MAFLMNFGAALRARRSLGGFSDFGVAGRAQRAFGFTWWTRVSFYITCNTNVGSFDDVRIKRTMT